MKRFVSYTCLLSGLLFLRGFGTAKAQSTPDPSTLPYLVQEVCVDGTGTVLRIDPYDCPSNDTLRQLRFGEPLPYHKHSQPWAGHPDSYLQFDSYPVRDLAGDELSISTRSSNPSDHEPLDVLGGYEVYRATDGWVSDGETKDRGGFSTSFFGANCKLYNGWVFFPLADLSATGIRPGRTYMPIAGDYWEENGETWPGKCPETYNTKSLTTWEWLKGYPFSGTGGNPVKRIDAIRSLHGFSDSPQWLLKGHMEIFYFTKLYGLTRWETWKPRVQVDNDPQLQQRAADVAKICGGVDDVDYQGVKFVVTACGDWSAVTVVDKPKPPAPWPVPDLNLLRNFHFGDGLANWEHTRQSKPADDLQLSLRNSTTFRDTQYSKNGVGVRYLALGCAGTCSSASELYQDVPISAKTTSGRYTFGAEARSEGSGGTLRFAVAMLDHNGKVLGEKSFTAGVAPSYGKYKAADSVHLSSGFLVTTVSLIIDPTATVLRFSISPTTNGTFDIVDAWLMKDGY